VIFLATHDRPVHQLFDILSFQILNQNTAMMARDFHFTVKLGTDIAKEVAAIKTVTGRGVVLFTTAAGLG